MHGRARLITRSRSMEGETVNSYQWNPTAGLGRRGDESPPSRTRATSLGAATRRKKAAKKAKKAKKAKPKTKKSRAAIAKTPVPKKTTTTASGLHIRKRKAHH